MSSMRAEYRHRETPLEQDARLWGARDPFMGTPAARRFTKRRTRRTLRHSAAVALRQGALS